MEIEVVDLEERKSEKANMFVYFVSSLLFKSNGIDNYKIFSLAQNIFKDTGDV